MRTSASRCHVGQVHSRPGKSYNCFMDPRPRTLRFVILLACLVFPARLTAGLWPFSGCKGDDEQQLEQTIERQQNPVKKSKCQAYLARLVLNQGVQAYDQRHFDRGSKLLGDYLVAVRRAWDILKSSGRNAVKHPEGFKELDIALRENGRLLNDLAQRVPYFQGEAVRNAEKQSAAIHEEVLDALFPGLQMPGPAKRTSHLAKDGRPKAGQGQR